MRVIDLSHTISEKMPVYPGTEGPTLLPGSSYGEDGFRETILHLYSHTGTHMDGPNHIFPKGRMLEDFSVAQFVGEALVVDCSHLASGEMITMEHLAPVQSQADRAEFLLFYTGWSRYWGQEAYFGEYPCLDHSVVDYLLQTGKKGIGLDTIGLDPIADKELARHRRLLETDQIVIIENLCNLEQVGAEPFLLVALPVKFEGSDGAPVRAVAICQKNWRPGER